jgi:hypothetical protein
MGIELPGKSRSKQQKNVAEIEMAGDSLVSRILKARRLRASAETELLIRDQEILLQFEHSHFHYPPYLVALSWVRFCTMPFSKIWVRDKNQHSADR